MNRKEKKPILTLVAGLTALAGLWLWAHCWRLDQANQAAWADLMARQTAASGGPRSVPGGKGSGESATDTSPAGAPVRTTTPLRKTMNPNFRGETLFQDPALRARFAAARTLSQNLAYGPFVRARQLLPEQAAVLAALIQSRDQQAWDVVSTEENVPNRMVNRWGMNHPDPALFPGPSADTWTDSSAPEVHQLLQQNDQSFWGAATDLLGADGAAQLREYERVLPVQPLVAEIAGALAAGTNPLSDDQMAQLGKILAGTTATYQRGGQASPPNVDWSQAATTAAQVLSQPQLAMLEAIHAPAIAKHDLSVAVLKAIGQSAQ